MPFALLRSTAIAATALLALAGLAPARAADSLRSSPPPVVTSVPSFGQTAEHLIGQDVHSTTGQPMGELRDLVFSADGQVVYALISTGGILGVGDIIRAVPFSAFTSTTTGAAKSLAVDLGGADWNTAPIVRLDQLALLNTEARGREIHQYFGRPWPVARGGARTVANAGLRLASELDGQQVMHGNESVGRIEDIYINRNKAFAVIAPADRAVAASGEIVVGLDQLSWDASTATVAHTQLTSADLAHAAPLPVGGLADADRPYRWTPMRADGQPPAPITDGSAAPLGTGPRTSLATVRRALHNDPELAPALRRVEVTTEGDQLRLTGMVASEELKQQLATEAMRVAKGWTVKNDVAVQAAAE